MTILRFISKNLERNTLFLFVRICTTRLHSKYVLKKNNHNRFMWSYIPKGTQIDSISNGYNRKHLYILLKFNREFQYWIHKFNNNSLKSKNWMFRHMSESVRQDIPHHVMIIMIKTATVWSRYILIYCHDVIRIVAEINSDIDR